MTGLIVRDEYASAGAPDPVLEEAAVLGIVRRHVSDATRVAGVDESGGEARVYVVETGARDLILKTQRPHRRRARTSLLREVFFLRHLANNAEAPLPIPRILGYGRAGDGAGGAAEIEYTLMTRVPGDSVQRAGLLGQARLRAVERLGELLREIHGTPFEPLRDSSQFPGDRAPGDLATRLETPALAAAAQLAGTAVERLLPDPADTIVRNVIAALPAGSEGVRVAVHANPGPTHTFVDRSTGAFTGLIDFGDAYISHPALDLRRWEDHAERRALLAGYQCGAPVGEEFLRVWRLGCVLIDVASLASCAADDTDDAAQRVNRIAEAIREQMEELA